MIFRFGLAIKPNKKFFSGGALRIMKILLSVIHFILCLMVIVIVLLQRRKQGGFSGAFGGGGTQADLSGQWQRFTGLIKITVVLFVLFMLIAVFLTFIMV